MDSVTAARSGDEAAFLQLFDEYHGPLYRFAYRMTGSAADAEDIVQECFLELLRPGCSYDPGRTPLRTYLFGVVRNQSMKRIQRDARAQEFDAEPAAANSPERLALDAEMKDVVASAVMQLPESQRQLPGDVLLCHLHHRLTLDPLTSGEVLPGGLRTPARPVRASRPTTRRVRTP